MDLTRMTRVLVALVLAVCAAVGAAGPASAQDQQNEFQKAYDECRDGHGPGAGAGGAAIGAVTNNPLLGAALGSPPVEKFLRESAGTGGARELLTAPLRSVSAASCNVAGAVQHPGEAIDAAAERAWDGKLAGIVREIKEGNPAVIGYTMSLWTKYKLDPEALEASSKGVNNIMWQAALAGLALSIVVGLMKVAASRRQGSGEALETAATGYGRYLLYGALIPAMAVPAIMAFDAFGDLLINEYVAPGGDFTKITDAVTIGEKMNPILVLVFVLISLLGSLAMCLALVMRIILLPIIIGLMPVFAAWAIGRTGKFTVENATGVLGAFVLLKVAAALVYSSAVWAALNLDGSEENKLVTMVIFGAAGLCAPALLAVILPQMKGQAGGSAGALGGALLGATGAATGATLAAAGGMAGGAVAAGTGSSASHGSSSGHSGSGLGLNGASTGGSANSGGGNRTVNSSSGSGPSSGGSSGPSSGSTPSSGGRTPIAGHTSGSGPSTGGGRPAGAGLAGAGRTGARIARNAGGAAATFVQASGGLLDDAVGAPVHPGRAYR